MSGINVTIGAGENLGIFHPACSQTVIVDGLVHLAATLHDVVVVVLHAVEHVEDADVAFVSPVAFIALVEVLDVPNLVVANHGKTTALNGRAEIVNVCQSGQGNLLLANDFTLAARQTSVSKELCLDVSIGSHSKATVRA